LIQGHKEIVPRYEKLQLGIKMIKLIDPTKRCHFDSLINEPELIMEQLLMNMDYKALEEIILDNKLAQPDELVETYARKALEVPVFDVESQAGSETTIISSTGLADCLYRIPTLVPSPDQWVPDNEVHICMLCKLERFSMFNRRHHCRRCGRVICSTCSSQKLLLPEISVTKSVRVCDQCHRQSKLERGPRKESSISVSSSHNLQWMLTRDEEENLAVRQEFYYESSPSASLSLSILRLHSD
jgi:hypothetical protein